MEDPNTFVIKKFEIINDSTLKIYYKNSKVRSIDFSKIKKTGWWKNLNNPLYFKLVKINEMDNLEWPEGNDFNPEHLYYWEKFQNYYYS